MDVKLHLFHSWTKWETYVATVLGALPKRVQRRTCDICGREQERRVWS